MIDLLHRGNLRNEEEEEKKKKEGKDKPIIFLYLHNNGGAFCRAWILGYLRLCQIIKTQKSREIKTSLPM